MRAWLSFALLLVASGCALDHERAFLGDGGPPDAAVCTGSPEVVEGDVESLVCPASVPAGSPVSVSLTSRTSTCCPVSAALPPVVSGHDAEVHVAVPYSLCDCCIACRCIGEPVTRDVVVSGAASGSLIHVTAGTQSCTIAVTAPAMCHDVVITSAHTPRAVADGTSIPVHVASNGNTSTSCGCTPRASTAGSGEISLAACDCCLDCDCIDFGYEATTQRIATGTGLELPYETSIDVAGSLVPLTTTIVDPARCIDSTATVTALVPIAPDTRLRQALPTGAWVDLRAFDRRCCGEPLELVRATVSGTDVALTLSECNPDPCDCASDEPHDASTPVYLGALPSGTYTVRAAGASTTITLP